MGDIIQWDEAVRQRQILEDISAAVDWLNTLEPIHPDDIDWKDDDGV